MTTDDDKPTNTRTNYGWFYLEETGFGWWVVDRRTKHAYRNGIHGQMTREQADALAYRLYAEEIVG